MTTNSFFFPLSCHRILFYIGVFRRFQHGEGAFCAGIGLPLPGKRKGLPRLAAALCQELGASQNCAVDVQALCLPRKNGFQMRARVCGILSRMSRNTTSKAVSDRPAFFDGGSRYRPGKGKRLPTFFTPKSSPFCASQHPHSAAFLEEPAEDQGLFLYRN